MPMFITLYIDMEPTLFALHDLLRIGDHYVVCSKGQFRVDESYAEIVAILDHFDLIIRKEAIIAEQLKTMIDRGIINLMDNDPTAIFP